MFVERWLQADGSEDREGAKFWIELYGDVLGEPRPTHKLDFERRARGRKMDVFLEEMGVLIENKSRGVDLDEPEKRGWLDKARRIPRMVTPYEQAKWYADNITPRSIAPKWIVTCNFDEIRIYDLDQNDPESDYETISLTELPDLVHRFSFMTHRENSRMEREKQLSVEAGLIVGKLYDALYSQYQNIETSAHEQFSLNVLITRIVFMLYAEDAGLLHEKSAFYQFLSSYSVEQMADGLKTLFYALKTPENQRDQYMSPAANAFPYVNGGLFENEIIIPQFTDELREILLEEASAGFRWENISPTIFGAVFESTLNPETRRSGGMHYTSVDNIHKVTGPLFYDRLKEELNTIEGIKTKRQREFELKAFRKKIAQIKVFDPACGSGNFLTETYLSLRRLENRVLENLHGDQMVFGGIDDVIGVNLNQFYGLEINDFAVEVAKTALWIAELQMLQETIEITGEWISPLPLKTNSNIRCLNALRSDWNEVLPAEECTYVIGNPPFVGKKYQSASQREDMKIAYGGLVTGHGVMDYVSAWYIKFLRDYYSRNSEIEVAFVSTSSLIQGEQAVTMWPQLFDRFDVELSFAHKPFKWMSETAGSASVVVVILGLARRGKWRDKALFDNDSIVNVGEFNVYLIPGMKQTVRKRRSPLSAPLPCVYGSFPLDGGHFTISESEYRKLVSRDPRNARFLRRFLGSEEVINGIDRYCVWIPDDLLEQALICPDIAEKVRAVEYWRKSRSRVQTVKAAATPHRFAEVRQPDSSYLAIPITSSQTRAYVPLAWLDVDVIGSNHLILIPNADCYAFGVLSSQAHNSWMRVVAGRLKTDYNYSAQIVYNNFVWPSPDSVRRDAIESSARSVLAARDNYPSATLAELYDPRRMPEELRLAHKELDSAVEAAYGVDFQADESRIVEHLFKLHAELL